MAVAESEQERFFRRYNEMLDQLMQRFNLQPPTQAEPFEPKGEDKKVVDEFMEKITPDIETVGVEILKAEMRDKILSNPANIIRIRQQLEKGIRPKLKRKKGCIFIQFGEGTPNEPIEEILIATT